MRRHRATSLARPLLAERLVAACRLAPSQLALGRSARRVPVPIAGLLFAGLLAAGSALAAPPNGTYSGLTSQGRPVSVNVNGGQVTGWTVEYSCPGFSSTVTVTVGSCPVSGGGTFTCGPTGCAPFVGNTRVSGTFSGSTLAGTVLVNHMPGISAPCCIQTLSFNASLPGGGPPAAPSGLTATALSSTQIELSWQDNSDDEDEFRIELKPQGGSFADVGSAPAGSTGTTLGGLAPDTTYTARVKARNGDGDSAYSNEASATTEPLGGCVPDATTLCLLGGRFEARVDWRRSDGQTGEGQAVDLTDRAGLFWFFNEANLEMLLKMQNACAPPFNRFWVFFAATTNVEFTVTVTDTQTGESREYTNPLGQAAAPVQDTNAFATCP
jgi:hypothetical protein